MSFSSKADLAANFSLDHLPRVAEDPRSSRRVQSIEDVAFSSGVALAEFNVLYAQKGVPQDLLRARLALRAAEACVAWTGRPERRADLRDAVAFLRPEDHAGPAGEIYLSLKHAAQRPMTNRALQKAFPHYEVGEIEGWLRIGAGAKVSNPVARAAATLEAVLEDQPKAEVLALVLADARLARAMKWSHVVPLLSAGMSPRDLRKSGEELRHACHAAVAAEAEQAFGLGRELTRKAETLRAVAPKLRAKGSDRAVELFLTQDAVSPAMLTHLMSDRAARRFCDRLVTLGVAREMTGRDSFRLYGI